MWHGWLLVGVPLREVLKAADGRTPSAPGCSGLPAGVIRHLRAPRVPPALLCSFHPYMATQQMMIDAAILIDHAFLQEKVHEMQQAPQSQGLSPSRSNCLGVTPRFARGTSDVGTECKERLCCRKHRDLFQASVARKRPVSWGMAVADASKKTTVMTCVLVLFFVVLGGHGCY